MYVERDVCGADTSDTTHDLITVFQLSLSKINWACHSARHLTTLRLRLLK